MADVSSPPVDLAAIKQKQQKTWSSGDFSVIAGLIEPIADYLVDAADLHAGWSVLDVATGSGNAAIAAARLGARVTGVDYVPELLERARQRSASEGFEIEYVEGDAEALPFGDASFDGILSVYGAMFAPDHAKAASEIARVSRPGGRIGLASWTPEGFLGSMFRTIAAHVPPPAGVASPMLWGTESHLEEIFGNSVAWIAHERRIHNFRFTSAEAFVDFFETYYGPTLKAIGANEELRGALVELARESNRLGPDDGAIAIPGEYLESVGIRA